ncbi:MAG: putative lipoprotein, partial [uncultured Gemmatimonadetes bacterium]
EGYSDRRPRRPARLTRRRPARGRRRGLRPAHGVARGRAARASRRAAPLQAHRVLLRQPRLAPHGHPGRGAQARDAAAPARRGGALEPGRPGAPRRALPAPGGHRGAGGARHVGPLPHHRARLHRAHGARVGAGGGRRLLRGPADRHRQPAQHPPPLRVDPARARRAPRPGPGVLHEDGRAPRHAHRHHERRGHQLRHRVPGRPGPQVQPAPQSRGGAPLHPRHGHQLFLHPPAPRDAGGDRHGRLGPPAAQARLVQGFHRARAGAVHGLQAVLQERHESRPPADVPARPPAPGAEAAVHPVPV